MSKLRELLFDSSEETEQLKSNAEFARLRNETVLKYFSRSLKLTAIPLVMVTVSVALILYVQLNSASVLLWVFFVSLTQIPRLILSSRLSDTSKGSTNARLMLGQILAVISGSSLASVLIFAPQMTLETRAMVTMVLTGLSAASVVTSLGYNRFSFGIIVPIFISIVSIWTIDPNETVARPIFWLIIVLATQLAIIFLVLNRQTHKNFLSNLYIQQRLTLALDSERSANAAKTRFLAAASHDLRQPLHALSLFSSALALRPLDDESKAIAHKMDESMQALDQELETLLDISKLDADVVPVVKNTVNISALVKTVCEFLKPKATLKKLDLVVNVSADIYAETDVDLFSRILRNLLDNAIKYTDVGSVTVDLNIYNNQARLRVWDTGIGISDDEAPKIWEEFYQVNNAARDTTKGLGLGLSVVKRVSKLLQVNVDLIRGEDGGACFEILLPQSAPKDSTGVKPFATTVEDTNYIQGRTVLVVDDDAKILLSTQSLLTGVGMQVETANSTAIAIEKFGNNAIDCVLIDLRLADGDDGFDAIQKLTAIDQAVPIIIVSGDTAPERMRRANELGHRLLVKPVRLETLLAELRRVL